MEDRDSKLRRELGVTRRDLLRRGAIVGGTLVWAAPVVQSMAAPAFAHEVSPALHTCCSCREIGEVLYHGCAIDHPRADNQTECSDACEGTRMPHECEWHTGPLPFTCTEEFGCTVRGGAHV